MIENVKDTLAALEVLGVEDRLQSLEDRPISLSSGKSSLTSLGGAANTEPFVTIGNTSGLTAERALTGTASNISITDNGANSTAVVNLIDTAVTPATYGSSTQVGQFTVDQKGRITAANNVGISLSGLGGVSGSGVDNQVAIWSGTSSLDGDTDFTFDGSAAALSSNGITTTSTPVFTLQNTTAATSGVTEQYSPAQDFIGHSWKSGLGASDRTVRFRNELQTTTNGNTPVGTFVWKSSVDTGTASYTNRMTLTTAGLLTIASLTVSGLTDTRVPFATTGGLLTDSAGMTFDSGNKILFVGQHSGKINDANLPIQSSTGGTNTAAYWGFNKSGAYGMLMGYSEGLNGWTGPVFRCVTADTIYFITNNTGTALTINSAQLSTFFGAVIGNTTITATTSLKTPLITPISTEAILVRGFDAASGTQNGSKLTLRGGRGINDGENVSNGADVEIYGGSPGFGGSTGGAVIFKTDGSTVLGRFTDLNTFAARAGLSTTIARSGTGTLAQYIADVSVGGTEADIFSFTTAANTLGTNGDRLTAVYGGNFVTVGTELTQLKVYFAGTAIWDSTGVAPTTGTTSWRVNVEIIRVSSTVVRYTVSLNTTGASGYVYAVSGELTGLTLSNTNIIKITGTSSGVGSGSGDIVGKMGFVEWSPSIAS